MLFVFDLDFTLWNCGETWCDHTQPPYFRDKDKIFDTEGRIITLYPDVRSILETLKNQNVDMAIASRTCAPQWAERLIDLFELNDFFLYKEIYPGSKTAHFKALKQKSGLAFPELYFFDDETRNIQEVAELGVNCMIVQNGLSKSHLIEILSGKNTNRVAAF